MTPHDTSILVCPVCRGALQFDGVLARGELHSGQLHCHQCRRDWPVADGLPYLYEEPQVRGPDRLMRLFYDNLAVFHDPAVRLLLPLLQTEAAHRERYITRLELGRLKEERPNRPLRILEVGVGGGANLPLIAPELPADLDVEVWGVDLSQGMIEQCRRHWARVGDARLRLLLADAHALPFPDASFDRVFHVGGIGGYRDPRTGLAEMARVARPGTPIVVVDEQLDPHRSHTLYHRLMFHGITFYSSDPCSPRALLPDDAIDVIDEQVCRFYYCLSFRMPPRPRRRRRAASGVTRKASPPRP